jgi:hypothetical protein
MNIRSTWIKTLAIEQPTEYGGATGHHLAYGHSPEDEMEAWLFEPLPALPLP